MDPTLAKELLDAVKAGLHAAVKDKLSSAYNNPLQKALEGVVEHHAPLLRQLLTETIATALGDGEFRKAVQDALRTKLAKVLVERFGGELERQVNQLKSDPATRARITLAVEEATRGLTAKA